MTGPGLSSIDLQRLSSECDQQTQVVQYGIVTTAGASEQRLAEPASQKNSREVHRQGPAAEAHQSLSVSGCAVTSAPRRSDSPGPASAQPAPTKMPCHWKSSRPQQGGGIHQLVAETNLYSRYASGLIAHSPHKIKVSDQSRCENIYERYRNYFGPRETLQIGLIAAKASLGGQLAEIISRRWNKPQRFRVSSCACGRLPQIHPRP